LEPEKKDKESKDLSESALNSGLNNSSMVLPSKPKLYNNTTLFIDELFF